uniref:Metalloendopeptidase n=1 Tax=Plecoglossus altivelis altivelis TaxID=281464 RepID=Q14TI3_PLEAT|nr:hatching enzyme [Plecoglossus altivelis altivelis]
MKMEISTSFSLLLILLGLSHAVPLLDENPKDHRKLSIGSILTTNNQSNEHPLEGDLVAPKTRNAMRCYQGDECKWRKSPNGQVMVAYTISNEYSPSERYLIEGALRAFASASCVRLVPRTSEYDYINIVSADGCYSALGRQGGRQMLSINRQGCMANKVILHETLHALGFQHEHTRSDRDQYVRINFANIEPSMAFNFAKSDTNNLGTTFDYGSIMQYPRQAFAINPSIDTIIPIPNPYVDMGVATTFSRIDIQRLNTLYRC